MVREATAADARDIAEVHVRAWRAAYRGILPKQLLDDLSVDLREQFWHDELTGEDPPLSALVAEDPPGQVAGFAVVRPAKDDDSSETTAEIAAMYVDPSRWRSGVGRSLLREALAELSDEGCEQVTLWVLQRNAQGRAFYARSGFRLDGARSTHEQSGIATVRMRLAFGSSGA